MHSITPIVQKIIILNAIVFLAANIAPQYVPNLAIYPPNTGNFQPFQLVSYMFYHLDMTHILMNMIGLFFLGTYVERALGPEKFIILYLASGIFAGLAQMYIGNNGGLGASGAVNGVLVAFAVMFPNVKLNLLFIPIPIRAIFLAIGLILYDLITGLGNVNDGIGHFAHLGGALMGLILILIWKPKINRIN